MCAASDRNPSNPLMLPELVGLIIGHVDDPPDLLNCACVNGTWSLEALARLYKGSVNDMRYRTPDICSLNSLFVASRKRFGRNMSFVKHLIIGPETSVLNEISISKNRSVCLEMCRPLRDRKSAELLLRPRGEGPVSLAIPFELIYQDLSIVSDLILHPGLKFLTVDHLYCELLSFDSRTSREHSAPPTLSNLAGLSIHWSKDDLRVAKLCEWLENCDLKLFQIVQKQNSYNIPRAHVVELLLCLERHRNLQALALNNCRSKGNLGKICAELEKSKGIMFWPRLRALYLGLVDRYWLEKLPMFGELQILRLRNVVHPLREAARIISCCQHLRIIDVGFPEVNADILLSMARGCPLLRRFCVHTLEKIEELRAHKFSLLLQALPYVECLSLDMILRMIGRQLRDLANSCPRLAMLQLSRARLLLSPRSLAEVPPLQRLEIMELGEVEFDHDVRLSRLRDIAQGWKRVFPRIRYLPCPIDNPPVNLKSSPLSEEPESDRGSDSFNEEMTSYNPRLHFDFDHYSDYGTDWFHLRRQLWRLIGYSTDTGYFGRACYLWQTQFEIELFGWPILPIEAYVDPEKHSTVEEAPALNRLDGGI